MLDVVLASSVVSAISAKAVDVSLGVAIAKGAAPFRL